MESFSLPRFVALLVRALEVAAIAALAFRWIALFLIVRYRLMVAGSILDATSNFAVLAILFLLIGVLWLLLTHQPHAVLIALRTFLYIVVFMCGPFRLGASSVETAQGLRTAVHEQRQSALIPPPPLRHRYPRGFAVYVAASRATPFLRRR